MINIAGVCFGTKMHYHSDSFSNPAVLLCTHAFHNRGNTAFKLCLKSYWEDNVENQFEIFSTENKSENNIFTNVPMQYLFSENASFFLSNRYLLEVLAGSHNSMQNLKTAAGRY